MVTMQSLHIDYQYLLVVVVVVVAVVLVLVLVLVWAVLPPRLEFGWQ